MLLSARLGGCSGIPLKFRGKSREVETEWLDRPEERHKAIAVPEAPPSAVRRNPDPVQLCPKMGGLTGRATEAAEAVWIFIREYAPKGHFLQENQS